MKNKKKYLFFTLFALGFMLTGINNQIPEENITNIASSAETDVCSSDLQKQALSLTTTEY